MVQRTEALRGLGQHPPACRQLRQLRQLLRRGGQGRAAPLRRRAAQRGRGHGWRRIWHEDRRVVGLRQQGARRVLRHKQQWQPHSLRRTARQVDFGQRVSPQRRTGEGIRRFVGTSGQHLHLHVCQQGTRRLLRRTRPHARVANRDAGRHWLSEGADQRRACGGHHLGRGRAQQSHQRQLCHCQQGHGHDALAVGRRDRPDQADRLGNRQADVERGSGGQSHWRRLQLLLNHFGQR